VTMCRRSGVGEASGFHLGVGDGYPRLSRGPVLMVSTL